MRGGLVPLCLLASGCDVVWGLTGDARVVDAPVDAPLVPLDEMYEPFCNADSTYDLILESAPGRRFRIDDTPRTFDSASKVCAEDQPGETHIFATNDARTNSGSSSLPRSASVFPKRSSARSVNS